MTASASLASMLEATGSGALRLRDRTAASAAVFIRDAAQGLLEISHNVLALVGLVVLAITLFASGRADVRASAEEQALTWLKAREEARTPPPEVEDTLADLGEMTAVERATATDPRELTKQQAAVAQWIARRYRVAPEPISRLVKEAWAVGERARLDPTLILAIMAVESSFNPFAQSTVGAQGLMQVLTRVHDDKYEAFGGNHAAFDPVTNLRVGVQVLKECIARAGSIDAGLRFYVGAANLIDDNGYANKVLAEQGQLRLVANGRSVPTTVQPALRAAAAPLAASAAKADTPSSPLVLPSPVPEEEAVRAPDRVALLSHPLGHSVSR
ncbi:MAG: Transglycosylase protein [Rhizobacter sp.]|nr:Transglycosylase protein [Rhizobacter sp.]